MAQEPDAPAEVKVAPPPPAEGGSESVLDKFKALLTARAAPAKVKASPQPSAKPKVKASPQPSAKPEVKASPRPPAKPEVKASAPEPADPPPRLINHAVESPWWPVFREWAMKNYLGEAFGFLDAVDNYRAMSPRTWQQVYDIVRLYIVDGADQRVNLRSGLYAPLLKYTETPLEEREGTPAPDADVFTRAYQDVVAYQLGNEYPRFAEPYYNRGKK